jgi:cytoskeletal protein CcmA (bactofilin family)
VKGAGSERLDIGQATATVIARDTRVEGQLSGKRPVRIEGALKGGIRLEASLEIVEGALVEGDVYATTVRIGGSVTGNVTGATLIELQAGASVKGDVAAPALHVVEGAHLEGRVQMTKGTPGQPAQSQ